MNAWMMLWKFVLIGGVALFSGMAIWVSIGGYRDIKKLFKSVEESHKKDSS